MTEKSQNPLKEKTPSASPAVIYQTVEEIRRAWKPYKTSLSETGYERDTVIRIHRACSWLEQVEKLEASHDQQLILLWISLNTLYGVWNPKDRTPVSDASSWADFLKKIVKLDHDDCLASILRKHRKLVMAILEDEHLSKFFWQDPTPKRAGQSKKVMYDARTWYLEERWGLLLNRVMERIYLVRCQLVHGAATCGGKLNRTALRRCATMLGHLQPVFLTILINHGAREDWGLMCYPPLNQTDDQHA
ncbi:hypothetical protein Pla110_41400 [Polystyrenella longa]|uniref:Uncharacterized protein n=2 Tax=Polystyrenella longa TaxID=2528007 RepID=A0A518CT54_9PLAN|nr:hypothetical protein Pla110_41400 [Polystyrenella longa]